MENDRLWELLKEKDSKIETLILKTGYLQAHLETSEKTVKLLEDRCKTTPWWRRVWKAITNG